MSLTNDLYSDRLGFVYLLTSEAMPGIVKIGSTRKHPLSRAKELSAPTGVPVDFTLAFYQSFGDCFLAESLTHEHFQTRRINESREFFELHVDEVIEFVEGLATSTAYRERVEGEEPDTVVGGAHRRAVETVATPFAELFASFDQDGPAELSEAEQAQCRALEARG